MFFKGLIIFIIGFLMFNNVRKRKPASKETKWVGQMLPQYIGFWMMAIFCMILGIGLILSSFLK